MKKFKSIRRAIQRGHLSAEIDTATQKPVLYRKTNSGRSIRYWF